MDFIFQKVYVPWDDGNDDADDAPCSAGELPCAAAPAKKAGGGDGDLSRKREQCRRDAAA